MKKKKRKSSKERIGETQKNTETHTKKKKKKPQQTRKSGVTRFNLSHHSPFLSPQQTHHTDHQQKWKNVLHHLSFSHKKKQKNQPTPLKSKGCGCVWMWLLWFVKNKKKTNKTAIPTGSIIFKESCKINQYLNGFLYVDSTVENRKSNSVH